MYIKINGSSQHYNASITTFKTQKGNDAVGIIGEMPITNKGFILYDDNDQVFNDLSEYIYVYGEGGKAYTKVEEVIEYGTPTYTPLPPSPYDRLSSRINAVNNQVNAITPYTETKKIYIGDTDAVFTNIYKQGNISAYLTIGGIQMPCEVISEENNIIITFDEAEEVGEVTISIQ